MYTRIRHTTANPTLTLSNSKLCRRGRHYRCLYNGWWWPRQHKQLCTRS